VRVRQATPEDVPSLVALFQELDRMQADWRVFTPRPGFYDEVGAKFQEALGNPEAVVLVAEDGQVENRIVILPPGLPSSALTEASNFLNRNIRGLTLMEARVALERALEAGRAELDQLTQKIVAAGLASWSGGDSDERKLIVRGHAHLLDDLKALEDLERVRHLFDDLETKRGLVDLLGRAERADGVRIYIGSENKLFSLSGSSTIIAPYRDAAGRIIGVIGVIGPTRLNYARIVPMVDYTAKIVGKLLGG